MAMSRRLFVKVVPGALVVASAMALTVVAGQPGNESAPTLSFTVDGAPGAVPIERIIIRRRTITPEFDPPLEVRAGRVVFARGFVACDPGEIYRVEVTVEQDDATGEGRTAGRCTGDVQEWTAVVTAGSGATFESGPSSACAVATSRRTGVTDTFEWCGTPALAAD
jgi:hypothetical protein